jgi:single-stranded-DNA-specific exonuclease
MKWFATWLPGCREFIQNDLEDFYHYRIECKRWIVASPITPEINDELKNAGVESAMLRQLLSRRGVHTALQAQQYLNAEGSLYDPFLLKDMQIAVDRILSALQQGEKIVVYGDYDTDGITATALLVQWLRFLKGDVQEYIPDRFTEGYGLNLEAMQTLRDLGVQLIITVDCGIRSIAEIALAKELGMDVIVSDHHWPEAELPPALAIHLSQAGRR